jgi:extradiol dioxygenase family protein
MDKWSNHSQPTSEVDGIPVPLNHFGAILEWKQFQELAQKLKENKIEFIIPPQVRYAGKTGEQLTMFFLDPSGNALEFKAFKNEEEVFHKQL